MSLYRKFRGLTDRQLQTVLTNHTDLHGRTFVWSLAAVLLSIVNAIAIFLHLVGTL